LQDSKEIEKRVSGHDFSRTERATKGNWALAPVVFFAAICNFAAAKAGVGFSHLRHD
jgi:hypothetical protein